MEYRIPRVVIAATQSGSGKTTLVTGLLGAFREQGLRVQAYKVGPDYIDPGYHALASGCPAHNLDTWLVSEDKSKEIFAETAKYADIAVIEGVMGLYDGGRKGISSTAEIAKMLDAPVLLVIDAKSMGASAAAIALGFKAYDPEVRLAGVLLNRLGSASHEKMIRDALGELGIPVYGAVRRNPEFSMQERHLGLLPTEENQDWKLVQRIAGAVAESVSLGEIRKLAESAPVLTLTEGMKESASTACSGRLCSIAVAKDTAFSFYYPESIKVLEELGAEIIPFSPLADLEIPTADGLILGGGFPEMFAEKLEQNHSMRESVCRAAEAGMPIYAECGGYMYLMDRLIDFEGRSFQMAGVIPAAARMKEKLQMVGYVTAELQADSVLGHRGEKLRGHEFHFSVEEPEGFLDAFPRAFTFTRMRNGACYDAGYLGDNIIGSYLHLHFAGCRKSAEAFVDHCRIWRNKKTESSSGVHIDERKD